MNDHPTYCGACPYCEMLTEETGRTRFTAATDRICINLNSTRCHVKSYHMPCELWEKRDNNRKRIERLKRKAL